MGKLHRMLSSVESLERVDRLADLVQDRVRRMLPEGRAARAVRGAWIGHPLHPVLVLLPVGSWLSAAILDLMPGQHTAARRLVAAGLAGAVPAALSGLAELRDLDRPQRRVAVVHALANVTATVCYAESYRNRRLGSIGLGRAWATLGLAAVGAGGTLGGHLAYAQNAGVGRWQDRAEDHGQPAEQAGEQGREPREDLSPRRVRVTAGD